MNLTKKEFVDLFRKKNFLIKNIYPVENMPFLYRFRFFREKNQKKFTNCTTVFQMLPAINKHIKLIKKYFSK
jgi:hypothetical protein